MQPTLLLIFLFLNDVNIPNLFLGLHVLIIFTSINEYGTIKRYLIIDCVFKIIFLHMQKQQTTEIRKVRKNHYKRSIYFTRLNLYLIICCTEITPHHWPSFLFSLSSSIYFFIFCVPIEIQGADCHMGTSMDYIYIYIYIYLFFLLMIFL